MLGNFDRLNNKLKYFVKKSNGLLILADNKLITDLKDLNENFQRFKRIELIPVSKFCAVATSTIAFTSIQVSAFAALAINTVIFAAISIGISFLLSKFLSPKQPNQVKTSSYIFSSKENLAQRNTPIPLNYGRLRVNSQVLNSMLFNFDLTNNFDVFFENVNKSVASNLLSARV